MQLAVAIEGQEAVPAGSLVLGATDRNVTFDLDGMKFELRFVPETEVLEVAFIRDDVRRLTLESTPRPPIARSTWTP